MVLTKEMVVDKIYNYLQKNLSLADLVNWAEIAMMEFEFEEKHLDVIRDTVAHLGLADVKAFGLTWEDCIHMLEQLGYRVKVQLSPV